MNAAFGWFHASAVTVAAAQLFIALTLLMMASLLDAPAAWVPFSAIALARVSSLAVAFLIIRLKARSLEHVQPEIIGLRGTRSPPGT